MFLFDTFYDLGAITEKRSAIVNQEIVFLFVSLSKREGVVAKKKVMWLCIIMHAHMGPTNNKVQ